MSVTATEYWVERIEEEGAQACRDGDPAWANPYVFGTTNRALWERGYDREKAKGARAWC